MRFLTTGPPIDFRGSRPRDCPNGVSHFYISVHTCVRERVSSMKMILIIVEYNNILLFLMTVHTVNEIFVIGEPDG